MSPPVHRPTGASSLAQHILQEIRSGSGAISFARYMELALYHPQYGYYTSHATRIGAEGDFTTAPEISKLFSQTLALECSRMMKTLDLHNMIEVGAGNGTLAIHLMQWLAQHNALPDTYCIVETSEALRQRQQTRIAREHPELLSRFRWSDKLAEPCQGIVIANELLDALPVHRFLLRDGTLFELAVSFDGAHFRDAPIAPRSEALTSRIEPLLGRLPEPYCSEVNLAAERWIRDAGNLLEKGVILLVDYGYPRHEYYHPERAQGTLMCYRNHQAHTDPYQAPGSQDITAHLDFTALAEAAAQSGLDLCGFTTQAHFLMNAGLTDLLAEMDPEDVDQYLPAVQAAKQLLLPGQMGESIKVMALGRGVSTPLSGFRNHDMRERLRHGWHNPRA